MHLAIVLFVRKLMTKAIVISLITIGSSYYDLINESA